MGVTLIMSKVEKYDTLDDLTTRHLRTVVDLSPISRIMPKMKDFATCDPFPVEVGDVTLSD